MTTGEAFRWTLLIAAPVFVTINSDATWAEAGLALTISLVLLAGLITFASKRSRRSL